ncbi:hypothetical protein BKA57DRAFT_458804 [Linnemannia elongata]|nr:hypothetical protein BKA57DRAFT_458804 [Linnemannia elongata]
MVYLVLLRYGLVRTIWASDPGNANSPAGSQTPNDLSQSKFSSFGGGPRVSGSEIRELEGDDADSNGCSGSGSGWSILGGRPSIGLCSLCRWLGNCNDSLPGAPCC